MAFPWSKKKEPDLQAEEEKTRTPLRNDVLRNAPSIRSLPASKAAIALGLDPNDPDAKIPDQVAEIVKNSDGVGQNQYLITYVYHVFRPELLASCAARMEGLRYLSDDWILEHKKFCSGSLMATILGLNPYETPEHAWFERIVPATMKEENEFKIFAKERGLVFEKFHEELFRIHDKQHEYVTGCGSQVHPKEKWLIMTPDAKVYAKGGRHVRNAEFKSPKRKLSEVVPVQYMPQLQAQMEIDDVETNDYSELAVNDQTGVATWLVTRVHRSREYWSAMVPVLKGFCRAVHTRTPPPPAHTFVEPFVKTEVIFRVENAMSLIPDWTRKLSDAVIEAKSRASKISAANKAHNRGAKAYGFRTDVPPLKRARCDERK